MLRCISLNFRTSMTKMAYHVHLTPLKSESWLHVISGRMVAASSCHGYDVTIMIQHGRPSVTPVRTQLRRSVPHLSQKQKNKSPLPHMLIRARCPKQRSSSSVRPLHPPRSLAPCTAHLRPSHPRCSLPRRPSIAHCRRVHR